MKNNYKVGIRGEKLALRYLISKGFSIRDTNVHLGKYAELDIVASLESQIHIVEVKTIQTMVNDPSKIQFPIYNITARKLKHLIIGTEIYLRNNNLTQIDYSIDALAIVIDPEKKKSWAKFFPDITQGL